MEIYKLFMSNFGLSLLAYFVNSLLGLLAFMLQEYATRVPNIVTDVPRNAPFWVEIILWLHVLIFIVLYYYLGIRLYLLGSHGLNFLSVSGSIVFGLLLMYLGPYALILGQFSFYRFMYLIAGRINNVYITISIISILPSIIIWIGMIFQSRKI